MASYKVIQDVEAEDKLIWLLTMKQFLYAMIAFLIGFAGWLVGKYTNYYLAIPVFLTALPFVAMALPLRRDQPNDVWLMARLNFVFRPRTRLWSQIGSSYQPVCIISQHAEELPAEPGHTQEEIETQVRSLSRVLDSRGQQTGSGDREAEADADHELQKSALNSRFKRLLGHHKTKRLKGLEAAMHQTMRSQEYHLSQYAPGGGPADNRRRPAASLTEHLDSIAGNGDLKISTLESLVKAAKSGRRPRKT